jgi:hypothetical protein
VLRISNVLSQIPDPDPNISHPGFVSQIFSYRIQHEKSAANLFFSCFLWFEEQSLSLSYSLRSGKNTSRIPDSGSKSTGSRIRNNAYNLALACRKIKHICIMGRVPCPIVRRSTSDFVYIQFQ